MKETMSKEAFAEEVLHYVKEALPEELAEAQVRTVSLDLWADGSRMALLVIRPWDSTTTGFCLNRWMDKGETAEAAAAGFTARRRGTDWTWKEGRSYMPNPDGYAYSTPYPLKPVCFPRPDLRGRAPPHARPPVYSLWTRRRYVPAL